MVFIMENKFKKFPKFDGAAVKDKAKQTWKTLNADNIEITLTTSAMGLMLFAVGVGISLGISRCITKVEMKTALRKQRKVFLQEKTENQ